MVKGDRIDSGSFLVNQLYSEPLVLHIGLSLGALLRLLLGWLELNRTLMIGSYVEAVELGRF